MSKTRPPTDEELLYLMEHELESRLKAFLGEVKKRPQLRQAAQMVGQAVDKVRSLNDLATVTNALTMKLGALVDVPTFIAASAAMGLMQLGIRDMKAAGIKPKKPSAPAM